MSTHISPDAAPDCRASPRAEAEGVPPPDTERVPPPDWEDLRAAMADAFDAGSLSATVSRHRRVTLVTVLGALGQHSREALRRALQTAIDEAAAAETLVAVDLRATDFTDESGWATLAAAHLRLSRVGRRLFVVLGRGQEKAAALRGLGLDTLLTRVDSPRRLARLG